MAFVPYNTLSFYHTLPLSSCLFQTFADALASVEIFYFETTSNENKNSKTLAGKSGQ